MDQSASIPGWMEWVIEKKYPRWRDVPTTAEGRAGTARLWIICRVFVAFALLWVRRRFAGVIDARESRAIEECGCAVAPLVLFALVWLLAEDSPKPSKHRAAPA
jgi:hypothetical protein